MQLRDLYLLAALLCVGLSHAQTRLVADPAISKNHLAFTYAGDLWVADRDGFSPKFSPDGKIIAFTAQYDGNYDVYTIPTAGGVPTRLTWHPGFDMTRDFTPDGKNLLFTSRRDVFTNRFNHAFTIGLDGGAATPLYSADGKYLAYTPLGDRSGMWKNYRGGTISRIWVMTMADKSVVEIPKPEGGCNDNRPRFVNGKVYFRSTTSTNSTPLQRPSSNSPNSKTSPSWTSTEVTAKSSSSKRATSTNSTPPRASISALNSL